MHIWYVLHYRTQAEGKYEKREERPWWSDGNEDIRVKLREGDAGQCGDREDTTVCAVPSEVCSTEHVLHFL